MNARETIAEAIEKMAAAERTPRYRPVNAAETIQAAIDKLTDQRTKGTPAPWAYGFRGNVETVPENPEDRFDVMSETIARVELYEEDGDLIVTLHRTIDAQLKLLTVTLALGVQCAADGREAAWLDAIERAGDLDLAKAILGDDEPKQPTEPDPEEHTDRQAWHLEEDADIARLNALMDGL